MNTSSHFGFITFLLIVGSCSGTFEQLEKTDEKTKIPVSSVTLSRQSAELFEGESLTLTASVSPSDATEKMISWSSSKSSIASVNQEGTVKALSKGTTVIKASAGGKTATCTVTVKAATEPVTSVTLNKTSLTLTIGETQTLKATVNPSNATNKSVTWSSDNTSIATVSSSGSVTAKAEGTAIVSVTTDDGGKTATCTITVQKYKAIDLGLSVKWAPLNLGASKASEYGDYFAWGETEPKEVYSWNNYKWYMRNNDGFEATKYWTATGSFIDPLRGTRFYGIKDWKTVLNLEDDAAHVNLGGKWRMPTIDEWNELQLKCSWRLKTMGGHEGCEITGPNGNSIFLPAAGHIAGTPPPFNLNTCLYYWSSSLDVDDPRNARALAGEVASWLLSYDRYYGLSIRPVSD